MSSRVGMPSSVEMTGGHPTVCAHDRPGVRTGQEPASIVEEARDMTHPLHPKERPEFSRRAFLQRAAAAGIALPTMSAILAACGSGAASSVQTSAGQTDTGQFGTGGISGAPYPLARPDAPV